MKTSFTYFIILLLSFFLSGCTKDFVVKNIKNSTVNIISPADNLSTPNNSIIFWWDVVEGAEKYNLQIVKPNFTSVAQLLVDTNITGLKFNYSFTPGTYQWRIKGVNAGGSTIYTTRTLTIDTTSNLTYGTVNPINPVSNFKTANKTITFSWVPLSAASSYNVVLSDATGQIATLTTANTSTVYTFAVEGTYSWKVQAQNSFSFSQFNSPRYFKIDQTSPQAPLLATPLNATTVKDTSFFRWNYNGGTANTDVKYDSIYISVYPDSFFVAPIRGSVTRIGSALSNRVRINTFVTYSNTVTVSPNYWWKVKSIDSTGNVSSPSQVFKFKLN